MSISVGIYRGSFDPPHLGHLETAKCALNSGMDRVVVTYVDPNSRKPERSNDFVRLKLLQKLFEDYGQIQVSEKSFQATLQDLIEDSTVKKIKLIIGVDLLGAKFRPFPKSEKLSCFVIPREHFPISEIPEMWNGLSVELVDASHLVDRGLSSSWLRDCLAKNELKIAHKALTTTLLEEILSGDFYPTFLRQIIDKLVPNEDKPVSFQLNRQGISGDLVFLIENKHGKKILVAKVFEDLKRFETECVTYQKLSQFPFKYVRVPKVHYADTQMIVMDFVEGKTLAELMQKSVDAVSLCAKANAELHLAEASSSTIDLDLYFSILREIEGYCPKTAALLKSTWDRLGEDFLKNPGLQCMTHGDPNHFNWIVDLDRQTVTYIDLSNFSENGFAMNEFYEARLCFWTAAKRVGGIDKQELQNIRESYKNTYFANISSSISTDEASAFFKAYWELRVIKTILAKGQIPEREISEFLKDYYV